MSAWVELSVLAAAIGFITAAVLLVIRDLVMSRRLAIEQRLGGDREVAPEELLISEPVHYGAGPIGRFDAWFDRLILESGLDWSPAAAVLGMFAAGILLGGVVFLWRENALLAGAAGIIGVIAVGAAFAYARARRLAAFDAQLPEVLELIARAVRAGETLEQAVELVASTAMEPSASELRYCVRQMQLGLSIDATFRRLAERVPLPELRLFSAALMVQRRAGGSLAVTLERFARAIRERQAYRRQLRVATAAGRWSTMVIMAACLGLMVYLFGWQYDYVRSFLETRVGQYVFILAIILQVIGIVWVLALTRYEA